MNEIRRIALVYDDERRPETTGVYCRRALESLVEVEFFRPAAISSIPRNRFDLVLNIDDGLRYRLPDDLRPSAWWCIDTHMDMAWSLEKSRDFDLVFAAQRDGAEQLRQQGAAAARWLQLACDPVIHGRCEAVKQWDFCFVGNLVSGPRADLVRLLQQYFRNNWVGRAYFEEMAEVYSASRVVFNRSIKNDVNMRVFEALASGSLLLTNDLSDNGQAELFRDSVHLATYVDGEELLDKLRYYLNRESIREQIAAAGRAEAAAKHTYVHRMREILTAANQFLAKTVVPAAAGQAAAASPLQAPLKPDAGVRNRGEKARIEAKPNIDWDYYGYLRPELLALVPGTARSILEIGCGAGRLGAALKDRQPCQITGVETNPLAAEAARKRLDRVIVGDIETLEPDFAPHEFDAVICGDVLEHLREPGRILRRIHQWLKPGGALAASIPNVAHRTVIANLLAGNWNYEPAGLLDATHLRFFTRSAIERLLYRTNFTIQTTEVVGGAGYDQWWLEGRPGTVQIGRLKARGLKREQVENLHAYQYLMRARAAPAPNFALTSIVIVTHNALDFTRRCLDSVRSYTDEPYELIVVDNASSDGTVEFLREQPDIRLIANAENRGFPAAVNQGVEVAEGEQILLLNGDVLVTTGWLRRQLEALAADPGIGLVGPVTNCTAGMQRVECGYRELSELEEFAWNWGKAYAGRRVAAQQLTGFCLLVLREAAKIIGPFDERFGLGLYEDVDYSLRARHAGFRLEVAYDAYVHHFGHCSFAAAGLDQDQMAQTSQHVFREKWNQEVPAPIGCGNGRGFPP